MVSGAFFQTAVSVIVPKGDSRGNDGAPVDGLSKLGTARSEHFKEALQKYLKSTLNNRLHRNLACVIDKSSRGAKLERAFEELP